MSFDSICRYKKDASEPVHSYFTCSPHAEHSRSRACSCSVSNSRQAFRPLLGPWMTHLGTDCPPFRDQYSLHSTARSPLSPPTKMPTLASRRTTSEQSAANSAALRGAAVGAAKFGTASLLLAVVGTLVSPLYRNLTIQFKVFLQLSGMTLGGWIEADRRLRGYEFWRLRERRRERDEAVWREWERRIQEGERPGKKG